MEGILWKRGAEMRWYMAEFRLDAEQCVLLEKKSPAAEALVSRKLSSWARLSAGADEADEAEDPEAEDGGDDDEGAESPEEITCPGSHSHRVAASAGDDPVGHVAHSTEPASGAYAPVGHVAHSELMTPPACVPGGHGSHVLAAAAAVALLKVPAGHTSQDALPGFSWYAPAAQTSHCSRPSSGA